jgi:hypothetical protein
VSACVLDAHRAARAYAMEQAGRAGPRSAEHTSRTQTLQLPPNAPNSTTSAARPRATCRTRGSSTRIVHHRPTTQDRQVIVSEFPWTSARGGGEVQREAVLYHVAGSPDMSDRARPMRPRYRLRLPRGSDRPTECRLRGANADSPSKWVRGRADSRSVASTWRTTCRILCWVQQGGCPRRSDAAEGASSSNK